MTFRDYCGDETFPNCSEKEYEERLTESLNWITKKYGKEIAKQFKETEEKRKKGHLEKLAKTGGSSKHFWAILNYGVFRESVIHRTVFYTLNKK